MTEYTGKMTEKVVSEFITSTCQVLPKSCAVASDLLHAPVSSFSSLNLEIFTYFWHCGSSAEFHIRPLNSCIADTDDFYSNANQMVFTKYFPVLPDYVHYLADSLQCFKIEPYLNYPGFVQLRRLGEMIYNWNYKKFEFSHTHLPSNHRMATALKNTGESSFSVRGPAITTQVDL